MATGLNEVIARAAAPITPGQAPAGAGVSPAGPGLLSGPSCSPQACGSQGGQGAGQGSAGSRPGQVRVSVKLSRAFPRPGHGRQLRLRVRGLRVREPGPHWAGALSCGFSPPAQPGALRGGRAPAACPLGRRVPALPRRSGPPPTCAPGPGEAWRGGRGCPLRSGWCPGSQDAPGLAALGPPRGRGLSPCSDGPGRGGDGCQSPVALGHRWLCQGLRVACPARRQGPSHTQVASQVTPTPGPSW